MPEWAGVKIKMWLDKDQNDIESRYRARGARWARKHSGEPDDADCPCPPQWTAAAQDDAWAAFKRGVEAQRKVAHPAPVPEQE